MTLTRAQQRVLMWLDMYPEVRLLPNRNGLPFWSSWWCDDSARQHMNGCMRVLGAEKSILGRGVTQQGTPRCTSKTFACLLRARLVDRVHHIQPCGIPHRNAFSISESGKTLLRSIATSECAA